MTGPWLMVRKAIMRSPSAREAVVYRAPTRIRRDCPIEVVAAAAASQRRRASSSGSPLSELKMRTGMGAATVIMDLSGIGLFR
jgi:hypothetical protein